ncbi:hypothetical protein CWC05_21805, partial [Pseudoalteromonas ruthenica]
MSDLPKAGLLRRLASLMYDGLVVIAFAMLTTIMYLFFIQSLISFDVLSLGKYEDVSALIQGSSLLYGLRAILLVLVSVLFFSYFW